MSVWQATQDPAVTRQVKAIEEQLASTWKNHDCAGWSAWLADDWSVTHIDAQVIGVEPEIIRERPRVPPARRRQFRMRRDHPRRDQGGHHRRLRTAARGQHAFQPEPVDGYQHRVHIAVRDRAHHLELIDGNERFLAERPPNEIDDREGQMRQVAHRLLAHMRPLAIASAQQIAVIRLALMLAGSRDHMDRPGAFRHARGLYTKPPTSTRALVTTLCRRQHVTTRRLSKESYRS